jgi:hypothetical protein
MRGYGHDPWEYIAVRGMGLLKGVHCPHYHYENRVADFHAMIRRRGGHGIAIDDGAAIEAIDGRYRILASLKGAKVWSVRRHRGRIIEQEVPRRQTFAPLAELYAL